MVEGMTVTVTIRRALLSDFPAVARLLAEMGREAVTPESEGIFRERFARHVQRPEVASLVAEVDGEVVGFCSLEFRERLNRKQREAWIPDLVVTEGQRGQGHGKALLHGAFEVAREAGCYHLTLETGYARKIAHQLYRGVGMVDGGMFMGYDLN